MSGLGLDRLERELAALGREPAPRGFAQRVLAAALGDEFAAVETPVGVFHVAWNAAGISAVQLMDEEGFRSWFARDIGRALTRVPAVPDRIRERIVGTRGRGAAYDLRGLTAFEHAVLMKTLEIPRGEVRTYAWVAREIGHPKAVRAVGTALANNPIPLLIPCHRVVRSDGIIGNYGAGGPANKRALLTMEGVHVDDLEAMARRGKRFAGSDSTRIFCVPTCRDARRVTPQHRVEFASEEAAVSAGYRPCRHCRPAGWTAA